MAPKHSNYFTDDQLKKQYSTLTPQGGKGHVGLTVYIAQQWVVYFISTRSNFQWEFF